MKKSILCIFVVLMTLSLALGAVSAEDVATENVVAEEAPVIGEAAGGDTAAASVPVADVEVDVENLYESDYEIIWGVGVANNGPNIAYDTIVRVDGSDNLYLYDYIDLDGMFYIPEYGIWYVGDLAPGEFAVLLLDTIKMDEGPFWVDALGVSDSYDHDLSNNYDIEWADVPEVSASAAEEETMPAAGNPIAMALLALISIAGATFARRL